MADSSPPNGILVVGAGAAGLMAGIWAAGGVAPVTVLDRTSDGGHKILISGGGRCNVLPSAFEPEQFHTDSSRNLLRNILRSWPDVRQRHFFETDLNLPLILEPESGKLFPVSQKARQVRDKLKAQVEKVGGRFVFHASVIGLEPPSRAGSVWTARLDDGSVMPAAAVILATGGLSVPGTGSDGTGLKLAARLGHTIRATYPALTPLVLEPPRFAVLSGISLTVTLTAPIGRDSFSTTGGFLFTHRGYSGPSVLDLSHLATRTMGAGARQPIFVQWTNENEQIWDDRLRTGKGTVRSVLRGRLPERLVDVLLAEASLPKDRDLVYLSRDERLRLVAVLSRYPLPWTGSEGYKKAEVTGGGVALEEIDPKTMESRLHPGLFLCGEMLDAFGPIGGYNFAWAWATGRIAGLGAKEKLNRMGAVEGG